MNKLPHARIILSIVFISILSFVTAKYFSDTYFAQSPYAGSGIEVSPPTQELELDPGESKTFEVKVSNRGSSRQTFTARIEDFTASGDEGQVALVEDGPWAISTWSSVSPQSFTLDAGEEETVRITINVPNQNTGGGRYGAVVIGRAGGKAENAASVAQEVASLFLVRISGPINESLQIKELDIPSFIEAGPVPMNLSLNNTGNVHVKATGLITVTNVLGKNVANIVVPPTNIFPQASRNISVTLDKRFLIGPYQTVSIIYYGAENKSLTLYTPFFVFPVRLIAGVIIVLFVLYIVRKRLKKALRALVGK